MKPMSFNKSILAVPVLAAVCGANATTAGSPAPERADIVTTAIQAGSFKTLVAAVQAAGLEDALRDDGPLTVFAPTDAAFAKLPAGTVETLLKPENRDKLTAILTYHVAPGRLTADKVTGLDRIKTLNGQRPAVKVSGGKVSVGNATVTATDVMASNGVIHVIDTVLLPADKDIIGTALDGGTFKTLAAALNAAGLVSALQGEGPFTVFAPSDAAFAKLPAGTVESLLEPGNKDKLSAILTYHVVPGLVYSADVQPGRVATLQGSRLSVTKKSGNLMIDQARVVSADIVTSNGVIHVIDEVILPQEMKSAVSDPARRLIGMAIDRGVPLFNHGQAAACTAVYEIAAQGLLSASDFGLDAHERATLEKAMERVRQTHDEQRQAWIMREALDDVMTSLR